MRIARNPTTRRTPMQSIERLIFTPVDFFLDLQIMNTHENKSPHNARRTNDGTLSTHTIIPKPTTTVSIIASAGRSHMRSLDITFDFMRVLSHKSSAKNTRSSDYVSYPLADPSRHHGVIHGVQVYPAYVVGKKVYYLA